MQGLVHPDQAVRLGLLQAMDVEEADAQGSEMWAKVQAAVRGLLREW